MAELSKETLAILDRLKREGALTRNATSGNSIKQIMGKLDKFSVVFENINTQIAQMNKTFGQMLGANPSTFVGPLPSGATSSLEPTSVKIDVESLRAMGIDEETIALQKQAAELNIKNNLEDEKLRDETEKKRKEDDKDKRQKAKSDELANYWRTKTISGQAMTNPLSFFTKLLKGAAIGFVGFNVVRGIVDQWTDGAFTKFVADIDYAAIGEGIKTFTGFLADSPWLAFSTALIAWTAIDFGVPLALNVTGEVIRTSMLAKMLNKGVMGGVEKTDGFLKTVLSLKGLALGAVGVGFMIFGEKIADYVRKEALGMSPEQIKNEKLTVDAGDFVSTLGYAAGGATIGAMFGPQGALIGGVLGFAYGIGSKVLEYMQATSEEKINFDKLGEQQAKDNAVIAQQALDEDKASGYKILSDSQRTAFGIEAQGPTQDQINSVNDEIADQLDVTAKNIERIRNTNIDTELITTGGGQIGGGSVVEVQLTSSQRDAKKKQRDADLVAALEMQKRIEADAAARILSGEATADQLVKVERQGFMEHFLLLSSSEIKERRARIARETEEERIERNKRVADSLSAFFKASPVDDFMTPEQRAAIISKVEASGQTAGIVNIITNEGARISNVDNSDKSSSSVAYQNLVGGGGGKPAMPTG
jgi:hypothetical protein